MNPTLPTCRTNVCSCVPQAKLENLQGGKVGSNPNHTHMTQSSLTFIFFLLLAFNFFFISIFIKTIAPALLFCKMICSSELASSMTIAMEYSKRVYLVMCITNNSLHGLQEIYSAQYTITLYFVPCLKKKKSLLMYVCKTLELIIFMNICLH